MECGEREGGEGEEIMGDAGKGEGRGEGKGEGGGKGGGGEMGERGRLVGFSQKNMFICWLWLTNLICLPVATDKQIVV